LTIRGLRIGPKLTTASALDGPAVLSEGKGKRKGTDKSKLSSSNQLHTK